MNALQPRHFDDASVQKEIDMNIGFEFIFDKNQGSQADKLFIKDVHDGLGAALSKLEALFKLLGLTLQAQTRA